MQTATSGGAIGSASFSRSCSSPLAIAACGGSSGDPLSTVGGPVDNGGDAFSGPAPPPAWPPRRRPRPRRRAAPSRRTTAPTRRRRPATTSRSSTPARSSSSSTTCSRRSPRAKTAVLATGGYIGASQESNDGDRAVATITYRIPATRWEDALDGLRGLATKVVAEQTQATEVGGQIVDLEARLRNLRASEQVLVDIAKGTGKVSDLLEVQARISDVRGQIEQLDGQRAQLVDQVAYGTLVTTFGTEVAQVQETAKGWNPGADVDGATATLIGAGQAIVSAGDLVRHRVAAVDPAPARRWPSIARWLLRRFLPAAKPGGPVAGWGGGDCSGRLTARGGRGRDQRPAASHAASAARARSRVRFQAGQPWTEGSVGQRVAARASAGARAARSAAGSRPQAATTGTTASSPSDVEIAGVEAGPPARRDQRRVDRALEVARGRRTPAGRPGSCPRAPRARGSPAHGGSMPCGASASRPAPIASAMPSHRIATRTTNRSSVQPYIAWYSRSRTNAETSTTAGQPQQDEGAAELEPRPPRDREVQGDDEDRRRGSPPRRARRTRAARTRHR